MAEGIKITGAPSREELENCPGMPSKGRMDRGPVACIECMERIPCNPCETACPFGAIMIGDPITNVPILNEETCTGCGECVAKCPGFAITLVDKTSGGGTAEIAFPYEYLPLPQAGGTVTAVNRLGEGVCAALVLSVTRDERDARTWVVRIAVPLEAADEVRSIRRLSLEEGK